MLTKYLKKLFHTRPSAPHFTAPLAVPGPVYVIGDIHGAFDALLQLSDIIDADAQARGAAAPPPRVYVGDYVDRGEASATVLAHLYELAKLDPDQHICLRGNHEAMMLDFLRDPTRTGRRWLRHGGLQTLASYGIGGMSERSKPASFTAARDALRRALPAGLEDWLQSRPSLWRLGNLNVVHAALDPATPPQGQGDDIRLWGHAQFATQPRRDGQWVIHGHTIVDDPVVQAGRIAIDTGAYATGRLTAAGFCGDQMWFVGT